MFGESGWPGAVFYIAHDISFEGLGDSRIDKGVRGTNLQICGFRGSGPRFVPLNVVQGVAINV